MGKILSFCICSPGLSVNMVEKTKFRYAIAHDKDRSPQYDQSEGKHDSQSHDKDKQPPWVRATILFGSFDRGELKRLYVQSNTRRVHSN